MIDRKQLWSLAEETMRAFGPFYQQSMRKAIQESGVPDHWFGLSLARGSDPAPFTVERFHALFPYAAQERFLETLETLAREELLERVGEGAYRLTDRGRETVAGIFGAAHRELDAVAPLPADEMDQLNGLLYRLVQATLEAPQPEDKWAIAYSRWTDPGEGASRSVKTDQYLTDLIRFRDDAHVAAWKPYGVSGHAWEALTFIWRGDASTAEELAEKLPYRSHSVEDYEEALQDLIARGWVVEEETGGHELTEAGTQVREDAEDATDRYFFVGWSALSEDELVQLEDLLARANGSLQAAARDQLWGLATEVSRAIFPPTRDAVNPPVERHGLDKPGFVYMLLSARRFEPDLVSAARLGLRGPYTNPAQYANLLAELAETEFLTAREDGEYELAEEGRAALHEVEHAFYTRLGEIPALPAEDLSRAERLLREVVEACLGAGEPASKWCISTTHRGHPSQEYAPLAKIDQHLDDLHAFRDDAHLASWQPHDIDGHAWEALTFIWRGEAGTAEELAEKLSSRGHSVEAYAEALAGLAGRGWVEETSDGFRITEEGQALRQQAEEATNRVFFAPWACLGAAETAQLHDLLTRLNHNLQEMAEDDVDAT